MNNLFLRLAVGFSLCIALVPCIAESSAAADPASKGEAPALTVPFDDEASFMYGVEFGNELRALHIADRLSLDAIRGGMKQGLDGRQLTTNSDIELAQLFL